MTLDAGSATSPLAWAGALGGLVTGQVGGGGTLHHLAGLLHAGEGDDVAVADWLRHASAALGATKVAYAEYELLLNRASRMVALAGDDGRWCHAVAPLEDLRGIGAGHALVRANQAGTLQVAAVRCADDTAQVLAFQHAQPLDRQHAGGLAQAAATLLWHLHCRRGRRAARGLTAVELLALLPMAASLTDGAGRAIERNPAFAEFMDAVDMHVATGRLRFDDPYLQDSWQVALAEVAATAVAETVLTATPAGAQWRVHLIPLDCALDEHDTSHRPMVLAVAEPLPPSAENALEAALANADRPLTPAESEVLNALLQGLTAKAIANARGASVNTVRSQIMAILEKTGHHNQKTLMAAFSNSTFHTSLSPGNSISGLQSSGRLASVPGRRR